MVRLQWAHVFFAGGSALVGCFGTGDLVGDGLGIGVVCDRVGVIFGCGLVAASLGLCCLQYQVQALLYRLIPLHSFFLWDFAWQPYAMQISGVDPARNAMLHLGRLQPPCGLDGGLP
jgi:hypothetical protein